MATVIEVELYNSTYSGMLEKSPQSSEVNHDSQVGRVHVPVGTNSVPAYRVDVDSAGDVAR